MQPGGDYTGASDRAELQGAQRSCAQFIGIGIDFDMR
jgi:hypothetical protein